MHFTQEIALLMGLALLVGFVRVLLRPARWLLMAAVHSVLGGAVIWLWDQGFSHLGYGIGLNPVTSITAGILGLPGFGLLLALKFLH